MESQITPQGEPALVSVSLIFPGRNPREWFDPVKMEHLEASIRAQGLLQAILVKPVDGGQYEIVAGERRFRAFTAVHGSGADIKMPVLITSLDESQAEMAALTENVTREGMTPVEEAQSAARVLAHFNGDRDEAALSLGWKREFFDRRAALMYAVDEVRAALQAKKIGLGHAELLAVLRKEVQKQALEGLLKLPMLPTVADFKERLEKAALSLDSAIFSKDECAGCQFNSGNQQALFAESISGGHCTNKPCYDGKTEAELQSRVTALQSDYQVVKIVRAGDNFTVVPLRADGPKGVGEEQAKACRTCEHFGAAVSALPDKLGEKFTNLCMNTTCNVKMVAARINAEKAAKAAEAPAQGPEPKAAAAGKAHAAKASQPAASSEPGRGLKEYREKVWRIVLGRVVAKLDPLTNRCVLLAIMLFRPRAIDSTALSVALKKAGVAISSVGTQVGPALEEALQLEQSVLAKALAFIPACLSSTDLEIAQVVELLNGLGVKLEDHWRVNEEFLGLLTKNEIDATADEIGIKAALGDGYSKLLGGKKDDLIKALLNIADFDYRGRIPRQMRWSSKGSKKA